PVLGLVRFDFQVYSTVADHYLYVAMLGPALLVAGAVAAAAAAAPRWGTVVLGAATIVATAAGAKSFAEAWHWRDSDTLFANALEVNPQSFAANRVLGYAASRRLDYRQACIYFFNALRIYPDDAATN